MSSAPSQRADGIPAEGSGQVTRMVGHRVAGLGLDVPQCPVQVQAVLFEHDREVPPHRTEDVIPERTIYARKLRPVQADALVQPG
jgi:hypothetical protein